MNDTPSPAPFDPAAAGWQPYAHDDTGFIGLVGPFWSRPKTGPATASSTPSWPRSKHHNRRGVVQGGMLMTFADRSMGMTCWYANEKQPQATVQLDMHFIDAVQVGEFVECKRQGGAPDPLAGVHERRTGCRRARRRDRQRRVEDAGQAVSTPTKLARDKKRATHAHRVREGGHEAQHRSHSHHPRRQPAAARRSDGALCGERAGRQAVSRGCAPP